jgi:beta-glucosidase
MNLMKMVGVNALLLAATPGEAQMQAIYMDDTQPIELRVKDALSRMTLEEKVGLCYAQSKFSSRGVQRLGIPEVWMDDGPMGVREENKWDEWGGAGFTNDSCTAFPALTCLAATWNPEMAAIYGKALGEEFRYREKDVMLGPGVNIYRTPLNGRNFEYMGEDPKLAATMVVPYIKEAQKNGVATCVKHFALNNQETWRSGVDVQLSDRALYEIYLPAFKEAIMEGGSWTIMGSYNKIRGTYACHNDLMLNKILKEEWGFDGCVITDWGGAHDTKEAVLNGLDIEMGSYTNGLSTGRAFAYSDYYLADAYLKGLKSGIYPMSSVEDKASRILRLIFRTAMNSHKPWGSFASPEHAVVARMVGGEGIVLLKNEPLKKKETALLPLDGSLYTKILVVGENATRRLTEGGGSASLKAKEEISPLAALQAKYGDKIQYAMGYASGPSVYGREGEPAFNTDSLRVQAVEMAKEADLILYIGGLNKNHRQDCEDGDRKSLDLPFQQDALITSLAAVNPKIVMVLLSGNAVAMPWIKQVPSIVQGWYLGSQAGNALVDVLSGAVNPSGKLPFSFPVQLTDCGAHAYGEEGYPGLADTKIETYKEDILVGYRWHDTKKIPSLFPFGHGLSYTTFKYGKAEVSAKSMEKEGTLTVTIPVMNTGKVAGKEVVQLYIGDVKCSVLRPLKELKSFQKITLAPGATEKVQFILKNEDLCFFDEAKHAWVSEPGMFKVYIGSSSTDIRATLDFELK